MSYELERQNGNLTYASSTMKDGAATITIGRNYSRSGGVSGLHALTTHFPARHARAARSCFLSDIQTRRLPHSRRRVVRNALRKDEQRLAFAVHAASSTATFSSDRHLIYARHDIVIALSDLIQGPARVSGLKVAIVVFSCCRDRPGAHRFVI
jgi:hypothetical protein